MKSIEYVVKGVMVVAMLALVVIKAAEIYRMHELRSAHIDFLESVGGEVLRVSYTDIGYIFGVVSQVNFVGVDLSNRYLLSDVVDSINFLSIDTVQFFNCNIPGFDEISRIDRVKYLDLRKNPLSVSDYKDYVSFAESRYLSPVIDIIFD